MLQESVALCTVGTVESDESCFVQYFADAKDILNSLGGDGFAERYVHE